MFTTAGIALRQLTPCASATVLWRQAGALELTVIVKATFGFVAEGLASRTPAVPLVTREQHHDKSAEEALAAASEIAPYIPSGSVLCSDARSMARVAVWRDALLVDAALAPPRAWNHPSRLALLGATDRRRLFEAIPEYPAAFDFAFFQSAPPGQQAPFFHGDEWLVLELGLPGRPPLRTQLPSARARARAVMLTEDGVTEPEPVELVADMLVFEPERERVSVVWRGHRPLAVEPELLRSVAVVVGVEDRAHPLSWPSEPIRELALPAAAMPLTRRIFGDSGTLAPPPIPTPAPGDAGEQTRAISRDALEALMRERSALPFAVTASPVRREAQEKSLPQVLPFGEAASATASVDAERLLPIREGDAIPWVAAAPFDVGTHSWQLEPPQNALIVIVKGTYDIVVGEPVRPCPRADFITGELPYGDEPNSSVSRGDELAVFKPKADVTLIGHAHAPGGRPTTAMRVRFVFGGAKGRFDRSVAVYGDRVWKRGLVSTAGDPQPFVSIPLTYERAFGGPSLTQNPAGRGHGDSPLLPNLELEGKPVTSPSDTRPPACFAPLPLRWAERWSKMGTYDRKWFNTRWPYLPADFDWSFFQVAPLEQQLPHLLGNESFEAHGVHPEHPVVHGKLCGERARAFALTRGDEPRLVEVNLVLDTVSFDFDRMVVSLVWRGHLQVTRRDAPEVRLLFALAEPHGAPERSSDEVYALLLDTLGKRAEPEAEEEVSAPPPPDFVDRAADAERQAKLAEAEAAVAVHEKALADAIAEAGLDPASLEKEPPPPDPKVLRESLAAAGASPAEIDTVLSALEPEPEAPATEAEAPPDLRTVVLAMLHAGDAFDGFDFEGADLSDLDFSGRSLVGANLARGTFRRASFADARLMEAQLGEGDFAGACFDRADLSGADLFATVLEGASFEAALLGQAELLEARAKDARFVSVRGESVLFVGGDWERCSFDDATLPSANFTRASIAGASFRGARLERIVLRAAVGPDVVFDGATMTAIRGEGCKLHRGSFRGVSAESSVFDNAELIEADFREARLSRSSFTRALCLKAKLEQTELCESNFVRARLAGASFRRANLMMSRLDEADLNIADLRDANLHACAFVDANLLDAKLGGAIITKSSLAMRR